VIWKITLYFTSQEYNEGNLLLLLYELYKQTPLVSRKFYLVQSQNLST